MSLQSIGSVALVGAGKMGLALARGWVDGGLSPSALTLVDPFAGDAAKAFATETGAQLATSVSGLAPEVLVLAVKPQQMSAVMGEVQPSLGKDTVVLSIAAGITLKRLSDGLQTRRVVRAMPNTPAQVGKGISGAVGLDLTEADHATADALLQAAGAVVWFDDEAMLDAVTAVSGSGPAYVFHLVETLAAAGERQGLTAEQAMQLARQTIIGAAALLEADPQPAAVLRQNVTSPKGTTAAALEILMGPEGMGPLLDKAVVAARRRSEELASG